MAILEQQLGELPVGFADDTRRRGDALDKVGRTLDDYANQVLLLTALPGAVAGGHVYLLTGQRDRIR